MRDRSRSIACSSPARSHEIFQLNSEGICESVDVIKVADDVDQLQDPGVSKAVLAEDIQIMPRIGGGLSGHLNSKVGKRPLPGCELCLSVVPFDLSSQFGIA